MTVAVATWDRFVADGVGRSRAIDDGVAGLQLDAVHTPAARATLVALAYEAFEVATQSLLLGAEDVGRLAMTCERAMDLLAAGALTAEIALPILASSTYTLRTAFEALASPDRSGARTEGVPLAAARYELETLLPAPGAAVASGAASGAASASASGAPFVPVSALTRRGGAAASAGATAAPAVREADTRAGVGEPRDVTAAEPGAGVSPDDGGAASAAAWEPSVGDDMLELFFEEAGERIEDLSVKLLDIEQRPGDAELLRDVFRDLHTLKGSSAMVGLAPMNQLAHAAEDLVGQLREGQRGVDGLVIDALLAALDGLRDIAAYAQARQPIDFDLTPILRRLRDPQSALVAGDDSDDGDDDATPPGTRGATGEGRVGGDARDGGGGASTRPTASARAVSAPAVPRTIRVDFDKLDRLMNLVGELVLGRDGLRGAIQALTAIAGELSSDRQFASRLLRVAPVSAGRTGADGDGDGGRGRGRGRGRGTTRRSRAADNIRLGQLGDELGRVERVLVDISQDLDHATGRLDSVSDDLRDQVMKLRMVPVGGVFRKHHRTVRDLGASLGKRVKLELRGEDTELDKLLVEALDEPLMHLVRNAVDHGVEPPDERIRAGKRAEGTVSLEAIHRGNQMEIRIADDGKGIDPGALRAKARDRGLVTEDELATWDDRQILDVIFRPGFSTAAQVSQVSGRGVGMDVVRQAIVHRLKGTIEIDSAPGRGTSFTLRLPLTLAIIQVLLARAGGEVLAIPLDAVGRTITRRPGDVSLIGDREVIEVRGRQVALIRLGEVLELDAGDYDAGDLMHVVLVEVGGEPYGLVCDHLVGKKEIVIKSLGAILHNVPCAAGATILGDRCALILDVPAIVARAGEAGPARGRGAAKGRATATVRQPDSSAPHVLVVEDSDVVRESLRRLLVEAGYRCTTAADGAAGLEAATRDQFDVVSTDVMMPRMDGYELTRALRARPDYRDTPIVMVTSRGERIDRVRGFDAGVDEYITKPHDRQLLLRAIRKLLDERREEST